MKEITKKRWGRFGWLCMSFVPMLGYLALSLGVSTVVMMIVSVSAVMGGMSDSMELQNYLMQWTMPISVIYVSIGLVGYGLWYYFGCKRKRLGLPRGVFSPGKAVALLLVAFGGQFIANYLILALEAMAPRVVESYVEMMEMAGMDDLSWIGILYVVIMGPIAEELVFRGVTFFYARRATGRFWLANTIQALAFGIMHMNLVQGIYAFFIGLVLGWIYERFHSLYASILVHILFNLLGTLVLEPVEGMLGDSLLVAVLWNLVGVAAFVAGMLLLRSKKERETEGLS